MSSTMRAVVVSGAGGVEVLSVAQVAVPEVYRGAARVRVAAAGLNRADILQRRGFYPAPQGAPRDILGLEFAGVVEACDAACVRVRPGDRVMGIVAGGAQAEYVVIHEDELILVPDHLSLADAAAIPEAFLTAFDALTLQADVRAGESVLISAVGSGVGLAALQLAKRAGALTIGTSRTATKLALAQSKYGLDHAFLSSSDADLPAFVRSCTQGRGVDVVLDFLGGGSALASHLASLSPGGRMVTLGLLAGAKAELDLGLVMRKRLRLTGSTLRSRTHTEKVLLIRAFERMCALAFAPPPRGSLWPCVDAVVGPDDIREAHTRLERDGTFGKLVLVWELG